jgi:phage terminase large subunit-like protein
VRDRTAEGGHWALVSPLAVEWRAPDVGVESTMMGTTLVRQAVRAGLAPFDLRADADKVTRAIPAGHMVTQGQVWLPTGADWLDEWVSECADFPAGAHDDQVDVLAYAAKLAHGWQPTRSPGEPQRAPVDVFDTQLRDALGRSNGHDPLADI